MITPVILAGGSGSRLWPLSRELYPKQLISLSDDNTLLQNTLLRLKDLDEISDPVVTCNEAHRFMVAEQLRAIKINPSCIILEPVGKNTAPAVAAAALKILHNNSDSIILVLPADHVIENLPNFHMALELGIKYAARNNLITFGIVPDAPQTGYGYIKKKGKALDEANQAYKIERFVEKPDSETAKTYLESGKFCWNSGMFMFKASLIIDQLKKYAAPIVEDCTAAVEKGIEDLDFFRLDKASFEASPSDSIDCAVMEKTDKGVVIPIEAGWNDLGSWDALWQTGVKDENQNVIKGDVLLSDVKNSYLHANSRMIAAVGLENHVVVETRDAVLVVPRAKVQNVKDLINKLRKTGRDEAVVHSKVFRPWGAYETIDISDRFQVKRITVKPGAKLSLQKHYHRAEHWTVVSGTAIITNGEQEILLKEDQSTYISLGVSHRLENPGKIPLELIEVQSGSYLGEDDIVRFDDVYGRSKE